jgi:hypothetical protein
VTMIIYNPDTKKTKSMFVDEYLTWLKKQADAIQINPIRRDGYSPLIQMFKSKKPVGYHCVKMSQSEVDVINSILPPMRKTDNTFNLTRIK